MIGLFDSGSGGLTVLHALRKIAPLADVVYFGDIANAPYGSKSPEELIELTHRGVEILQSHGADVLVSACNSVSASVLAGAAGDMPFVEMSMPAARYLKQFAGQRFLLIATPATIASRLYEKAVGGSVALDSLPVADLAAAIEFDAPENTVERILTEAFSTRTGERYDGLILGCTHYPLALRSIQKIARNYFGELLIIDSAIPVAETVADRFGGEGKGEARFLISQKSRAFEEKIKRLFPETHYSIEVLDKALLLV